MSFGVNEGKGRFRMSVVGKSLKVIIVIKSESDGVVIVSHTPFQFAS